MRGPVGDSAAAKRQTLIDVATRLFAERGFGETSMSQIARAASVSKGTMYHYFESKDDLLYCIYHPLLEMQRERLAEIVQRSDPIEQRVRDAAHDVVLTSVATLSAMTVFFQSAHLLQPEKGDLVNAERRKYHDTFVALVAEGQETGAFRQDVSANIVVHGFFGSVHHLIRWYDEAGPMSPDEIAATLSLLLVASIEAKH